MRGIAAVALLLTACGGSRDRFDVLDVEPAAIEAGAPASLTIVGRGFYGEISVQLDDDRAPEVARNWRVLVGPLQFSSDDVEVASTSSLRVVVPATLGPGVYDVSVHAPSGAIGTLGGALTVHGGDAGIDDGGLGDANAACAQCAGGTCAGGVCVIDCPASHCADPIRCPPGVICEIECGNGACGGGIDCGEASFCQVRCSGSASCSGGVTCGAGPCRVECNGDSACGAVDCRDACACRVQCSGNAACTPAAECPGECSQGRGCTDQAAGCDRC